jgi:iron complex outermembrane receptor protein
MRLLHAEGRAACAAALVLLSSTGLHADEGPHAHDHDHAEHDEAEVIVVTASPLAHDRDELASSVAKLDRRAVLEGAGTTIGETINRLPGVASTGFAAGASRPVIRGQDAFRTGVVEDGLGTGDVSALSPDHGVPINPLSARSIEVVRGPATLRYGGGAIAGVVNTLTGRVPRQQPDELVTGDVFGAAGHNANERQLAFVLEGGAGPMAWHFDGMMLDANDYDIPDAGNQPQSFIEATSFSGGGAYVHERGRLGFAYSRFDNEYGIPEEGEDVSVDLKTNRYRVEGDLEEPLPGLSTLRTRWAVTDYEHDEVAAGVTGQSYENDEVEGRLEALHEPLAGFMGALGMHLRYRDEKFRGEAEEYLAPAETLTVAGYLFEEITPLEHLDVQAGLRIEGTQVEGTPAGGTSKKERDFVPASGSLALLLHPNDWFSVGVTGSVAQRAPSSPELFARGPHEATSTFETGDADLDEETSYTGELVLRVDTDRLRGEVAHFITRYDDYIFGELTGRLVDEDGLPGGDLDELFYRARNAHFYGGEALLEVDLYELYEGVLGVGAQLDWVRGRFTAGQAQNVPRVTPMRWGGGAYYRRDTGLNANVRVLRHERQDRTGFAESETDSFVMVDADVSYRLGLFDDRASIELFLNGRNLANQRARNAVALNKDDVLLPAARVRVGVRGTF